VEKAIINLSKQNLLSLKAMSESDDRLEMAIKSAGYFNQKGKRLRDISSRISEIGGVGELRNYPTGKLRDLLLSWNGIGPETADSILCYAYNRPVFVVDNYTKRFFDKMDLPAGSYDEMQELVHRSVERSASVLGDFHARIVNMSARKEVDVFISIYNSSQSANMEKKESALVEFRNIPGVGKKIALDLWNIGFGSIQELAGQDPEDLYRRLNEFSGSKADRCILYVFRCAVYFTSNEAHDQDLLKWWNWKDT